MTRRLMGLSHRKGGYQVDRGIPVPTRDGIQLLTDHYVPDGTPNGTILIRGPYGRGFPTNATFGALFAGAGFHVLIQSVRGTFGSTGSQEPFVTEAADGQDTVAWLRTQSWFDGKLATMGGSYLGLCQWALLDDPPPELRACVIVVGPHDFGRAMYRTGAFSLAMGFGWSEAMATQEMGGHLHRLSGMLTADKRTRPGLHDLPLAKAAEPLMHGRAPWYNDWLSHDDPGDSYWEGARHPLALQRVQVPTLLVGGWQDIFLDQTIEQYRSLHDRDVDVALTVGPWTHLETVGKGAGVISRESLDWLDRHLAGDSGVERDAPVHLFVTGAEEWRSYPDWPPPAQPEVYNIDDHGVLGDVAGDGTSTFVFDPADPTPAVGGPLLHPRHAGVKDNRDLEARSDVLTFTSSPLTGDLDIIGTPRVELELRVDNPHADVFVRLCDVDPKGQSHNFTDELQRLDPSIPAGKLQKVTIEMRPCAHRLLAGHRLRLQVSGGAHPRYVRNYGTGEPLTTGEKLVPSTHTVVHAGTRVILPVETTS
jgi:putative CocE/NonD family hydrolase